LGIGESLETLRNKQTKRLSDEMKTSVKTRNTECTAERRKTEKAKIKKNEKLQSIKNC